MGNNIKQVNKSDIKEMYDISPERLGSGGFAVVHKAIRKSDGTAVAIKIIDKRKLKQEELKMIQHEVTIMDKVNHPHCVKLLEVFDTEKRFFSGDGASYRRRIV